MSHPILIRNAQRPKIAVPHGIYCDSFLCRLRGYTFRKQLSLDEGLLMVEPREARLETAIHMLFVWTDLAVFWINNDLEVVDRVLARAWRPFYAPARAARYIMEIHPERLDDFRIGEKITLERP
jgi:uncharacterized protein